MPFEIGVRPEARTRQSLLWEFPGAIYRAETRFLKLTGSIDMAAATGNYDLAPASGERLLVNRASLIIVDSTGAGNEWDDGEFGNNVALATGLTLTLRKSGAQVHDFTAEFKIKTNQHLFAYTAPDYSTITLESGNRLCVATWDFVGSYAPLYLDSTTDILRMNVGDSLAGIARCNMRADCLLVVGDE